MHWNQIIPDASTPPAKDAMEYYGLLGDYVGGFWGTVVGVLTLFVVLLTWRASRRTDYRSKTYQVFAEMLRTHEEIVTSMRINSFSGRDTFVLVLSEFYAIYKLTREAVPGDTIWSVSNRIDIAYTYTFFGPQLLALHVLKNYDQALIKKVHDAVHRERQENKNPKRVFAGHQNRLSHYFRNLYSAYSFIDNADLTSTEKIALAKVLRSKLSNYEQGLLALNVICQLGQEWERTGILEKYKPIKNIPELFFTFDRKFSVKEQFPYIDFEYENTGDTEVRASRFAFRSWTLVLLRKVAKTSNTSVQGTLRDKAAQRP
ncbi:putative phage abortive infection protein [Aromatoleum toluclasticum]|uniref:putative phage abortive infection protein n=1 Tax=Aromatoleum toluclasticum TaxID=92003 RepID=UPI000A055732|nr:putative phage abortive infection protein [Aromatoleum toluclasticum]